MKSETYDIKIIELCPDCGDDLDIDVCHQCEIEWCVKEVQKDG